MMIIVIIIIKKKYPPLYPSIFPWQELQLLRGCKSSTRRVKVIRGGIWWGWNENGPFIVDLPIKNCDFPIKNGDLPIKHGDFPIKHGDVPIKNGDFPVRKLLVYQKVNWMVIEWYLNDI